MDNAANRNSNGCTGGSGGYCKHDMYIYFQNKIGATCSTRWLFNQMRWKRGQDGKNLDDAFDSVGWDCFSWNEVACVSGNGFYVPNKVLLSISHLCCIAVGILIMDNGNISSFLI